VIFGSRERGRLSCPFLTARFAEEHGWSGAGIKLRRRARDRAGRRWL
jgi:hypothetical protein